LAQWRVQWLIEQSTSHQLLWCIDSFVLRNPPLRQAPKRYAQGDETTEDDLLHEIIDKNLYFFNIAILSRIFLLRVEIISNEKAK